MRLPTTPATSAALFFAALVVAPLLGLSGCATPAVGDPCLPEQIPETGFDARETYIESNSVQCETRVCIVHQLDGDPTCPQSQSTDTHKCAAEEDVERSVYCTCRCDTAGTGFAACECPSGYSCVEDVLSKGGPGVRGGYCINNQTVTR